MKFTIISILFIVLICQVRNSSAYREYHYEYYYPEHDYYIPTEEESSGGNSLADYWKVFKETFQKSYKDLNKPYVIERKVPIYIPVDRVRTVVKHHPVFIKPNRNPVNYRRPPHYRNNW